MGVAQYTDPGRVTRALRRQLVDCWIAVSNDGGAAGFPFPPVDDSHVAPVMAGLVDSLHPDRVRLIVATRDDGVAGWVVLRHEPNPVVAHWGTVHHLQTHPAFRGTGQGIALMRELRRVARDELGLAQLHLAARGGVGLEDFYARLGWREIGRWPGALRLGPGDMRDEVLMILAPL